MLPRPFERLNKSGIGKVLDYSYTNIYAIYRPMAAVLEELNDGN